jgi:hypothetical protein
VPLRGLDAAVKATLPGDVELANQWIALETQVCDQLTKPLVDELVGPPSYRRDRRAMVGAWEPDPPRPPLVPTVAAADRLEQTVQAGSLEVDVRGIRRATTAELPQCASNALL